MKYSKSSKLTGLENSVSKKHISFVAQKAENYFKEKIEKPISIFVDISVNTDNGDWYSFGSLNDFQSNFTPDSPCISYGISIMAIRGKDTLLSFFLNCRKLDGDLRISGLDNVFVQENMNELGSTIDALITQERLGTDITKESENVVFYAASSDERTYKRNEDEKQQKREDGRLKKQLIWGAVIAVTAALIGLVGGILIAKS